MLEQLILIGIAICIAEILFIFLLLHLRHPYYPHGGQMPVIMQMPMQGHEQNQRFIAKDNGHSGSVAGWVTFFAFIIFAAILINGAISIVIRGG